MIKRILAMTVVTTTAFALTACSSSVKLDEPAPIESRGAGAGAGAGGTGAGGQAGAAGAGGLGAGGAGGQSARPVAQVDAGAGRAGGAGGAAGARGAGAVDPLNDPASPLAKRSVYFDFDSFVIKPEFQPVVEAHAKYLVANKGRRIVVQGNTDERGSREYNLALGQKRSEAVRKALSSLGVAETQVEAVSFGEEKPKATGANEEAWAENRRADLVY